MKFNVSGTTPAERNSAIVLPIYKRKVGKIHTTKEAKLIKFVLQTLHKILNKN